MNPVTTRSMRLVFLCRGFVPRTGTMRGSIAWHRGRMLVATWHNSLLLRVNRKSAHVPCGGLSVVCLEARCQDEVGNACAMKATKAVYSQQFLQCCKLAKVKSNAHAKVGCGLTVPTVRRELEKVVQRLAAWGNQ